LHLALIRQIRRCAHFGTEEADLELVMLPADASIEMLAQHLPDAIAMIVAFTDINESLLAKAQVKNCLQTRRWCG
jgi:hypothetical protein